MRSCDIQLRYFLKIADVGSMSIAGQQLGMTQSALSKQITALESYLDQSLFVRNGRGVTLTPAGETLRAAVAPSFEAIERGIQQLRGDSAYHGGALRIATVHTLSYDFVPALVLRLLRAFPKVSISIAARSSPEVAELVESGRADVGLVYDTAVASERLISRHLFDEQMCLVAHRNAALGPDGIDLNRERLPLIVFPPAYALRRMLDSANVKHTVVTEVETLDMMLKMTSARLGYCVLPDHLAAESLADWKLVKHVIRAPLLQRRVVGVMTQRPTALHYAESLLNMAADVWAQQQQQRRTETPSLTAPASDG